jgi:large repetitive protein
MCTAAGRLRGEQPLDDLLEVFVEGEMTLLRVQRQAASRHPSARCFAWCAGTATDNAGNVSAATNGQVKVDADGPTVGITGCPTAPVLLGSTQSINVSAADQTNGSGLANDPSGTVTLPTGSVGPQTKTVTATDKVGHTKSETCSYSVNYGFSGFLQPINWTAHQVMGTNASNFKAGSTVPVKFRLTDANGNPVQAGSAQWLPHQKLTSTRQAVDEATCSDPATAGTLYKWDPTAQQYVYNWSTKGISSGFYYKIGVKLDDGQTYYTYISLR